MVLFCGCFIALITTAYAFFSRMYLCGGQFSTDFGLDKVMVGNLQGAGIWPFGVSIILFNKDSVKHGLRIGDKGWRSRPYRVAEKVGLAGFGVDTGAVRPAVSPPPSCQGLFQS